MGRVQTPTLAMLVERELAIRSFVPEDYIEVVATFRPAEEPKSAAYRGTWFRERGAAERPTRSRCSRQCGCRRMARRPSGLRSARAPDKAAIESIEAQTQRMPPPAALRPDGTAAPRQPPLRLQRAEDAGHGAGPVREPQADQLPAHRQPAPLAGRGAHAGARRRARSRGRTGNTSRRAPESVRWGGATWTMPRSPTTTPSSPPSRRPNALAYAGRAQDLRSGLPPAAQRLARRSHLERHHRDHGHPQRAKSWTAITPPAAPSSRRVEGAGPGAREGEEGGAGRGRRRRPSRRCRRAWRRGSRRTCSMWRRSRRRRARPSASPKPRC